MHFISDLSAMLNDIQLSEEVLYSIKKGEREVRNLKKDHSFYQAHVWSRPRVRVRVGHTGPI